MKNLHQVKLGGGIFIQEVQDLKKGACEARAASARSSAEAGGTYSTQKWELPINTTIRDT